MSKKYVTQKEDVSNFTEEDKKLLKQKISRLETERLENERLQKQSLNTDLYENEIIQDIIEALGFDLNSRDVLPDELNNKVCELKNMCEAQIVYNAIVFMKDINELPNYNKHKAYNAKRNDGVNLLWHEIGKSLTYKGKALTIERNFLFGDLVNFCNTGKDRAEKIIGILDYKQ